MGGKNQQTLSGTYGTKGVASASNVPGVRRSAANWIDSSGNFWLFGGYGHDGTGGEDELNDLWEYTPSSSQWTWVSGTDVAGESGSYGTKGTGSTSNYPGGRSEMAYWSDSSGNFWFFGGGGRAANNDWGYLNDLWKYTPSSSQWTWVSGSTVASSNGHYGTKGTGSTNNYPGARSDTTGWIDGSGDYWIFGGWGNDSVGNQSVLNDLWEFTPSNSKWTWISGSTVVDIGGTYGTKGTGATTNTPGARMDTASWTDASGNLWLFGGGGLDGQTNNGDLNDLWEFTSSSKKWTWVSGASVIDSTGTFGTRGTGSTSNVPSARAQFTFSKDSSGNFWLFGGNGYDSQGNLGFMNDQWEFTPSTSVWTWVTGSSTINASGTYGTKGAGSTSNIPGARMQSSMWLDSSGNSWIFGGFGADNPATSGGSQTDMNDLWEYTPSSGDWTWVSGYNGNLQQGYYGTLGTPSASNIPSARQATQTWVDSSGNLWMFGGTADDSMDDPLWEGLNDLWEYSPTSSQWTWKGGTSTAAVSGIYGTQGTGSTNNIPGSRSGGMSWSDTSGNLWLFGGNGFDGAGNEGDINDLWKYTPSSSQWMWVGGSSLVVQNPVYGTKGTGSTTNIPGSRDSSATWTDASGNFWLFGGYAVDAASNQDNASDLWEFSPSSSKWTWVSGSSLAGQSGVYGTLGTGSTSNYPGGRLSPYSWIDASGSLWLFGGLGYDSQGNYQALNDLWKYVPSSSQWTWVGGSSLGNANGVYGTKGLASSSNIPGARYQGVSWSDSSGCFWLIGGFGNDSVGNGWVLSDIWRYTPLTNQWTWMSGSSLVSASGVYNTQGVTSLSSIPGAGVQWGFWHDQRGFNWMFGGNVYDAFGALGQLNTLWKMSP
jgi:N-acetylneuraminic acid mutarotase